MITDMDAVQIFQATEPLPQKLWQWLQAHQHHCIFTSPEWFTSLINFKQQQEYTKGTEYFWLFIFKNDEPCVAVALEKNNRKLRLISNFYTPFNEVFFNSSLQPSQAWSILLAHLNHLCTDWLSIEVTPLYPEQLKTLIALQSRNRVKVFPYSFSVNFSSNFQCFSSYWSSRPSRLRNTYSRRYKALQHAMQIQLHHCVTDELMQDYWQIYQRSWKVQEPSDAFINWLLLWAGKHQKLRLGMLKINGQPAAFQLWLVNGTTAYIYKLAQDKQYDSASPGTILMEHMIRTLAQQDHICQIDFLLGNDAFKALWMDEQKEVMGVEIVNQVTLNGKILTCVYRLRNFIKNVVSNISGRI